MRCSPLIGDIALYKGQPVVHTHIVAGFTDDSTRGARVLDASVNSTLEVMASIESTPMGRRFEPATGFTLIDLAVHE